MRSENTRGTDSARRNGSETDISLVQKREGEVLAKAYASAEHREAVDAFLNKRAPVFKRQRLAPEDDEA